MPCSFRSSPGGSVILQPSCNRALQNVCGNRSAVRTEERWRVTLCRIYIAREVRLMWAVGKLHRTCSN